MTYVSWADLGRTFILFEWYFWIAHCQCETLPFAPKLRFPLEDAKKPKKLRNQRRPFKYLKI